MTRTGLTTDGSEFRLPGGASYVGQYHIHSTSGAMVGYSHTSEKHEKLTPVNRTVRERVTAVMNELKAQEAANAKKSRGANPTARRRRRIPSSSNTPSSMRTTPPPASPRQPSRPASPRQPSRPARRTTRTITRRSGSGGY